jgi:dTDP-4-amino-4,6-dideoxygalactose transaminase
VRDLESRLTPRTRAILVAHLFGGRCDLTGLAAAAHRHGLLVFEDAAQAFDGGPWRGHPEADLSFFSFGMIKTATAFGGGLVRVADPGRRERMRRVQDGWPAQRWRQFAARVVKVAFLSMMNRPLTYTLFDRVCGLWGTTADAVGRRFTRSFGSLGVEALLRVLRHRPCDPLMRLLAARLSRVDAERVRRRASYGERVFAGLSERAKPGCDQPMRTHWLVPVAVADPAGLRRKLRAAGFDSSGPSNVTAFGDGRARALMNGLVFLPAYPELPAERLEALIDLLREHLSAEC